MKYIALIIASSLLLPSVVDAESSLETFCEKERSAYEIIMKRRQEGKTLIEQIRPVNNLGIIDTMTIEAILYAYELPLVESEKKEWMSKTYGNGFYEACIDTKGYGRYE